MSTFTQANNSLQATRDGGCSSASRFTLVGPACLRGSLASASVTFLVADCLMSCNQEGKTRI